MMQRSLIASAAFAALYALPGAGELAGQDAHTCEDRAGIRVTVLDATGTVPVRADVRVRWADVVRKPGAPRCGG